MRLRGKLIAALAAAALVPVGLVSVLSVTVIVSSLDRGLRHDALQQLRVARNQMARAVDQVGDATGALAGNASLSVAIRQGAGPVASWLTQQTRTRGPMRVQVLDADGQLIADRVIGGDGDAVRPVAIGAAVLEGVREGALPRAALEAAGEHLVARGISALVSSDGGLLGYVALTLPIDGALMDLLRNELGTEVAVSGRGGRLVSTFRDRHGARREELRFEASIVRRILAGERLAELRNFGGATYQVAIEALAGRDGEAIGVLAVALDRASLAETERSAVRSMILGGLGALGLALGFAVWWSGRLGAPLARLHRGATAVSRGQLDYRLEEPEGDEIGDLAKAFNMMTSTLKENQARLAARMREIVALHDAGRAVSSVIDLSAVARKIVESLARTFEIELVALWLVREDQFALGAARARRRDVGSSLALDDALAAAAAWEGLARQAIARRGPIRVEGFEDPDGATADPPTLLVPDPGAPHAELDAQDTSSVRGVVPAVAMPMVRKERVVGVLVATRTPTSREFSEAELNLLRTFSDQAGTAVENAFLYDEVRAASEELERKVELRTGELLTINEELGRTVADLRETQAQLVLSERLAGLGMLVAGVAHEINSPSAAIRGSVDALADVLARASSQVEGLTAAAPRRAAQIFAFLGPAALRLSHRRPPTGPAARQLTRSLAGPLAQLGDRALAVASSLADLGADPEDAAALLAAVGEDTSALPLAVAALADHVFLQRTASTINSAVARITRIVGALKAYSHLDQQATRLAVDLREGIESTLTLLEHALRDIVLECRFGDLPEVPVFVDELNQVWTNLIQNAVQAMSGKGRLIIETALEGEHAVVRVIDDGPGIPEHAMPSIFEPFFTTKPKGQGTGLGLRIARQIVTKHEGEVSCRSRPGETCFEVRLPLRPAVSGPT
ncbi:MAG: ATP-binding protein [Kofleriaceae bacterium]